MDEAMPADRAEAVRKAIEAVHDAAYTDYTKLLQGGTARELARVILPLSLYTEWYWQIDLHNLFRFIRLRLDPHAQREIRAYAAVMKDLASKVCPMAFESFERHLAGGVRFSDEEMEALRRMLEGKEHGLTGKTGERFETKLKEGRQV